jgi:rod shape determining protein RodA
MTRYLSARDLDWTLLLIALALCSIGILQIYSATLDSPYHSAWWHQILYVGGGLLLMWLILAVDYHTLLHYVPTYYILSVAALLVTYVVGQTAFGSRRWIPLGGGLHLQVSEFVKLMIILLVARYLAEIKTETLEIREMTILSSLVLVPYAAGAETARSGDLVDVYRHLDGRRLSGGLRRKYVIVIAVVTMLVLPVGWYFLKDFQRARLVSFLDPDRDPQGAGYQLIQSQIAVGAGGMFGKGVTKGTQTQLTFPAGAAEGFYLLGALPKSMDLSA